MFLQIATFEFMSSDGVTSYWVKWEKAINGKRKFDVNIFINGDYVYTVPTDHRLCEKNSIEILRSYLKRIEAIANASLD
jgi:hypothetical protein